MNSTIETFGYPETLLKEYRHWVVMLRPAQVTIGSLVIAAKSNAIHLGQLGKEEWAEFATVSAEIEACLVSALGAEKFNYLALMMKDPNVHFHMIPRYSKPIVFNGVEYADADWPLKTEMAKLDLEDETLTAIHLKLKNFLGAEL